jgi:hypothetical protein
MVSPFLTLALDGDEWSASCPSHFISEEEALTTPWIGDWVGPWTLWRREKSLAPAGEQTLGHSPSLYGLLSWKCRLQILAACYLDAGRESMADCNNVSNATCLPARSSTCILIRTPSNRSIWIKVDHSVQTLYLLRARSENKICFSILIGIYDDNA